jgi:glutamine synthetase
VTVVFFCYGLWPFCEPETFFLYGNLLKIKATSNACEQNHPAELALPSTLWEAAQRFRQSDAAREMLGSDFVDHYAASREWEEREFRKHITDWEMDRYFEII